MLQLVKLFTNCTTMTQINGTILVNATQSLRAKQVQLFLETRGIEITVNNRCDFTCSASDASMMILTFAPDAEMVDGELRLHLYGRAIFDEYHKFCDSMTPVFVRHGSKMGAMWRIKFTKFFESVFRHSFYRRHYFSSDEYAATADDIPALLAYGATRKQFGYLELQLEQLLPAFNEWEVKNEN